MKKSLMFYALTLCIMIGFTFSTLAQSAAPNAGKAPVIHQNPNVTWNNTPPLMPPGDTGYGWEAFSASFISFPLPAGNPWTTVAAWAPPAGYSSAAIRGGDGNYYFIDPSVPSSVYQVDMSTGTASLLGAITGMASGANVNGLAYDPVNDTYYICGGVFGSTNNLYSLDMGTLTATLVASFVNTSGAMIGIAINSSGVGFGFDLIDDNAYTFDPVSGTSSLLGPLGYDANYAQDMDIDQATGTIYLAAYNNTTGTAQLRTMDPASGATTLVYDWGAAEVSAFAVNNSYPTPVELTSFTASTNKGNVTLSWSTATETNNQRFEIQRNEGSGFVSVGFVNGQGTTTQQHSYAYIDKNVKAGSYTYRLKQVDFNGTAIYSNEVNVKVTPPARFALIQNYPNPFNPTTKISFNLAVDSKVSLTVYNLLGQEITKLANGNYSAGIHEVTFNATNLNSGVYFYRLTATGNNGQSFASVKKMILTK